MEKFESVPDQCEIGEKFIPRVKVNNVLPVQEK